ncbi:hypothetical protein AJ85_12100 [Alkalihalobacillus alcalophilus ATCC 27647 = CGMCC 1.3604]|uniref:Uncharacterized protein n=1 Tax=Alkalihalobacillus alcalophilus ATCC 27647 = CGMCC 1.3604 TaxID=1218173 RepID=A0A094WGY5_ALKAL|nr:hypothetical protein [Alkalihalobacillus alcalophilus]KGA96051.1 hypothetical protein BALCAV_0218545 [Alkalihalobacillus alcalophilus ATCC 27647 = CGMCC 1.3604]MED1563580.1 hypothetical protein [Alkalihalobacillus alcalophilus]THG92283.1 hypothetical protein AJ85_12100 [Alkalihalobacillus alcalophilus ATCC 27647 = CGMCC 1.3604]
MDRDEGDGIEQQKTKLLTGIGCFLGLVFLMLLVIFAVGWLFFTKSFEETQLEVSFSPNDINKIEVVKVDEFPDPILRIKYDDKSIMKTKLPQNISIEWKNDYEAEVILTRRGSEPDIVKVEFEEP